MSTIDALSRGPKYMSDSNGLSAGQDRLDYLASPELVDILTRFMLGGRSPEQVEEGVTHPMDPNRDRTTYLSQQPPPTDILGSAMHRGDPLVWMEQVVEPEGTPEPSLVEVLARKAPQLLEQIAIMGGAAKGATRGVRSSQPRMAWEPQFGAEKPRPASTGPRKPSELLDSDLTTSEPAQPKQIEPSQELIDALAAFKDLTPEQFDSAVNSVEVVEPSATNLPVNASAESGSGGSLEALNRRSSMGSRGKKYVIVDRAGNVRPSTEDTPRLSPNEAWGEMDAEGNFRPLEGNMSVKAPKK